MKSNCLVVPGKPIIGKVVLPDVNQIREMTLEQLTNLTITKVLWHQSYDISSLCFILSDGQACRAGTNRKHSFDFPNNQQIIKVEVFTSKRSCRIKQFIFYGKHGVLVKLGKGQNAQGEKLTFDIGENERLIGCKLLHTENEFKGINFLKWTIH